MTRIKYIRIVAPISVDDMQYLDREIDNISQSIPPSGTEMACTMIIEGHPIRTYAQSKINSHQMVKGNNDSRWGRSPGWLIKKRPSIFVCL